MFRSNLHVLSLVTLLTGCIAELDTGDDLAGEESRQDPAGEVAALWSEDMLARALKRPVSELEVQKAGPTADFGTNDFRGHLGSQIYSPVANASTAGLGSSFQPSCGYSNNAPDAVYTWTAPTSGSYVFTTTTSYYDTILELRPFNDTSASLGCNDDWGSTLDSSVTVSLAAGQTVYVIVDGYNGASGSYRLNIARGGYPSGWTTWRNRDLPSGNGDYETLSDFVNAGQVCANPISVECQTLSGVPWYSAGEVYTCNTSFGGFCRNYEQPDGYCLDYRARFLCP
jgi:hypothetical protein